MQKSDRLENAKEMGTGVCGVYAIYLAHNPKVGYIGSAKCIRRRLMSHLASLRRHAHKNYRLQALYRRHGEEPFRYTILEESKTAAIARQREQKLIDFTQPELLYNLDKQVYKYKKD